MSNRISVHLAAVLAVFVTAATSPGAEPWADARLMPPDGLQVWLDAAQQAAAHEADKLGPLKHGDRLAELRDASGFQRHVVQADPGRQPKLVQVGSAGTALSSSTGWVVRFDGQDDHLRLRGLNRRWSDFTMFVVAAPHSNLGGYRGLFSVNQAERKDYETGFNLDLNAPGSAALQNLNLEGRGFGGARNLLKTTVPFGTLHVLEAVADASQKQVRMAFDGKPAG
ncbi:MAG TPA: hypothetical protein VM165_25655, partial [Planctomycetaceae bacterium]|nr:hypothetical protein [Planctomycetaceae bacterium]